MVTIRYKVIFSVSARQFRIIYNNCYPMLRRLVNGRVKELLINLNLIATNIWFPNIWHHDDMCEKAQIGWVIHKLFEAGSFEIFPLQQFMVFRQNVVVVGGWVVTYRALEEVKVVWETQDVWIYRSSKSLKIPPSWFSDTTLSSLGRGNWLPWAL